MIIVRKLKYYGAYSVLSMTYHFVCGALKYWIDQRSGLASVRAAIVLPNQFGSKAASVPCL